jgi:hypothetical protein
LVTNGIGHGFGENVGQCLVPAFWWATTRIQVGDYVILDQFGPGR